MSHCKNYLRKAAENPLLDDASNRELFINVLDLILAKLCKAAVADGVSADTMMKLLINHAHEVRLDRPGRQRQAAELVLQEAMRLHSAFDSITPDA